jgi:hypothetical protein
MSMTLTMPIRVSLPLDRPIARPHARQWEEVKPGDWIRAGSSEGRGAIQGVVESVHEHPEYGLVVSLNDTRRAVVNWRLLEVRACEGA